MIEKKISVRVRAEDENILDKLFDTNDGIRANSSTIEQIQFELGGVVRRRGMSAEDVIITIVINVTTGLTTGLLAAWIYDKLTDKGKTPIEVGDDPEIKTTIKEIEDSLLKQSEQKKD